MPAYLLDSNGNRVKHSVLSGRAHILQLKQKPGVWIYRQLIEGQRRYVERTLGVLPLNLALKQAEDLYLQLQNELDTDGQPMLSAHSCKLRSIGGSSSTRNGSTPARSRSPHTKAKKVYSLVASPLPEHKNINKVHQLSWIRSWTTERGV